MTAPAEIQIDVNRATTKLRRMAVGAKSQNDQLRALSLRYTELVELRTTLENAAIPCPPQDDPKRPFPHRRRNTASRYSNDMAMRSTPLPEWQAQYRDEQMRLVELDHEIEETLRARDQLSASWAATAHVIEKARVELQRRIGQRIERF